MLKFKAAVWLWSCLFASCGLLITVAQPQEPKKQQPANVIQALIDKLTQIDHEDTGYSASVSGSAFLPLGQTETHTILFGQKPQEASEALKSLVKLGVKALPALIEHLSDSRLTKIELRHSGGIGAMFVAQDEEARKPQKERLFLGENRYTVMVGDLCYVAIGQIVNRGYIAVRYQPTNIIIVTSVPKSKELREGLAKEWNNLTPDKHRDSLIADLGSDDEDLRDGASIRLAYYYPTALEAAALKQIARPTYSVYEVHDLIRDRLYPSKTAKERKTLVQEFVTKHGEIARDGIRWALFNDLNSQEADEEGRRHPKLDPRYQARESLIDVFGLPATVKSSDRPKTEPLSETARARFIRTLHFDPSKKLDDALRDLLAKTDDDYLAKGCLDRLVGRGYDADIEAYLKRRLPLLKEDDRKELLAYRPKLGWTRLHAAVDLDVPELVESVLKDKVPVDARANDGRTALHVAAAKAKPALAELLLRAGANPNIQDGKRKFPVQLAAHEDDVESVRILVKNKSEIPDILVAGIVGEANRLAALLKENPIGVKLRNGNGLTPLHVAAREGKSEMVRMLLHAKADVNAVDDFPEDENRRKYTYGWTPLHLAAMAGKTSAAAILVERGANVNIADKRGGHTPLHFAAWFGNADLVKLLLAHHADRDAKDQENRTPLALAEEKKQRAVTELLKAKK